MANWFAVSDKLRSGVSRPCRQMAWWVAGATSRRQVVLEAGENGMRQYSAEALGGTWAALYDSA